MANLQPFIKFALLFSLLGIVTKLVLWQKGLLLDNPEYSGMSYLLSIMMACFFSLYTIRRSHSVNSKYINDYKYGMKSVAITALIISVFTYGFYEYIDPEYFPNRISTVIEKAEAVDPSTIKSPIDLTKEDIIKNQTRNAKFMYNSANHSVISLFLFLLLGAIYSTFVTWLVRKFT
ncbi:MAG: DUF4199 domain-containing protein [Flavobacteriales bacterium]|jgi:hypothetical protein|nr:DUF4199 domain-containing protein [Flavobacteriales bacterium]|tara:strand:+ start:184 stop:711 length:528 start_codon:yes stop_codon:yes gene_type:complete